MSTSIAYFEVRLVPGLDPAGKLPRKTIQITADPGHEVEQWDRLIAAADPALYVVAPHAADGTVCGLPDGRAS